MSGMLRAIVILLFTSSSSAGGQTGLAQPDKPVSENPPSRRVFFTAASKDSSPLALTAENLQLKEDGKLAKVNTIRELGRLPIHYCVLFDISRSEREHFRFQQLETNTLLSRVLKPKTDLGWVAFFYDEVRESTVTDDPQNIESVILSSAPQGGTALYDAVAGCAHRMEKDAGGEQALKAMFLFTDGDDDASNTTLDQAADEVVRAHVVVEALTPVNELQPRARRALEALTQRTGGRVFALGDEKGLERAIRQVSQDLNNLLEASYTPSSQKSGILKLELRCQKKGVALLAPERIAVTQAP